MMLVFLLLAVFLLLLNAFFVLAEFAAIKMRSSRVEELIQRGDTRARLVRHIQSNLDEYLSVCQVGITLASIGLGFVGEPVFARLIEPAFVWAGAASPVVTHSLAITVAYILVSYLHIVIGEQVPKLIGIRKPEAAALWTARPLELFRLFLWAPIQVLNHSANAILRCVGLAAKLHDAGHTEEELRIILARSQHTGLMSFRRLLFLENIFDLGDLVVRDAMRPRDTVKVLRVAAPWDENLRTIREFRFSRYPLIEGDLKKPIGILHIKDLLYLGSEAMAQADLKKLARPCFSAAEDTPLENLLADLQRRHGQAAIVLDRDGNWTGFITLEDILEEIVGTIGDEFEAEPPLFLADTLSQGRILLGVRALSLEEAVQQIFSRISPSELPRPADGIVKAVLEREKAMSTYLGRGLAIPHARLEGLEKAVLIFARSEEGIPVAGHADRAHLVFLLLTPMAHPRIQARLLARVSGLMESEYVEERLRHAETSHAVLEAIREGDPIALS